MKWKRSITCLSWWSTFLRKKHVLSFNEMSMKHEMSVVVTYFLLDVNSPSDASPCQVTTLWHIVLLRYLRILITPLVSSNFSCQCVRLQRNKFRKLYIIALILVPIFSSKAHSTIYSHELLFQICSDHSHYSLNLALDNNQSIKHSRRKSVNFWEFNKLLI